MDNRIDIRNESGVLVGAMSFETSPSVSNNVFLSVTVKRGSWYHNLNFGSRLHLLHGAKNVPAVRELIPQYMRESLQWLLDHGRIKSVDTITEVDRNVPTRVNFRSVIVEKSGNRVEFNSFVAVA